MPSDLGTVRRRVVDGKVADNAEHFSNSGRAGLQFQSLRGDGKMLTDFADQCADIDSGRQLLSRAQRF